MDLGLAAHASSSAEVAMQSGLYSTQMQLQLPASHQELQQHCHQQQHQGLQEAAHQDMTLSAQPARQPPPPAQRRRHKQQQQPQQSQQQPPQRQAAQRQPASQEVHPG